MSRRARVVVLAVAVVAFGAFGVVRYLEDTDDPGPRIERSEATDPEWDLVIPAGTADRIAAGEEVEIVPARIDAKVGESIRIRNLDDTSHVLGPWYVDPGDTLSQRFASPGTFEGECNVHPSGQIEVVVEA